MFQPWRLKLKEAEEAVRSGRLEEAGQLLSQGELQQFLPAKKLLAQVAGQLAERGKGRVAQGETLAGWHDWRRAAELGADSDALASLRQQLIERTLTEAERYLEAGEPATAIARLDSLANHQAQTRETRQLEQVARKLDAARGLARRGEFSQAAELTAAAFTLQPDLKWLAERQRALAAQAAEARRFAEHLHAALAQESWTEALALAEQWLELAPESETAHNAQRRAWKAVGMELRDSRQRPVAAPPTAPFVTMPSEPRRQPLTYTLASKPPLNGHDHQPGPRFFLWVDGVGGFLVCEGHEVILGQPVADGQVDVPIQGDLSRQHALIRRDGEGYLLTPLRPTKVAGRAIEGVASLTDGCLIELGEGVRLRFRRPHPLSNTARLEFVSRHRTQPSSDGVLLMGESCILGPAPSSHIHCPDWSREVVLFHQEQELFCRVQGRLEIDGIAHQGEARLTRSSRITGDDFSLSLEEFHSGMKHR